MGLWAEKEKNEFFFCISPIAIANFSVGWQTLKYLYDILIPAERNAKKMSTCQKNPELKKIRCKLYTVIWFPETWRELRQAALYLGKKAQILSKTGKKKMKMDFYSLWFTYKLDSISFENRRPWSVRNMYARHLLCRKWAENCILSCSCLPSLQTNFKYSTEDTFDKIYYHSMQTFLPFHWPKAHHVTCK